MDKNNRCSEILILFFFLTALKAISAQTVTQCCDLNLLDADSRIALETDRILQIGTFQAMRVRLCTTEPVAIQIWTRVSATQFQFKWQTQLTPTSQQTNEIYSIINLENNPVTLAADDRLAVYSPSNSSSKISIPYDRNTINGDVYYSLNRYTGGQFAPGQQINFDSLKWPRTFSAYVNFCDTVNNCAAAASTTASPVSATTRSGGDTGVCCPPPGSGGTVSCDPSGVIGGDLNDQNNQIKQLEDQINRLLYILNNLLNSTVITGICPSGFVSGVYGVGSCYVIHRDMKLQLGQAALFCRDNYKAELVKIESAIEDQFLKNSILNRTQPTATESFWTAGMYNLDLRNWFWYTDNARIKAIYTYRNWLMGMEPTPEGIHDVCSVFTVDPVSATDYWQKKDCTENNYFICEIPKQCL